MKRALKIIGIIVALLLIIIIASALIIPVVFKERIKTKIETEINSMINARVSFGDYKLSLIKAFPNAVFSLKDLSVTGTGTFEDDTLAAVRSLGLVFNLMSIFGDEGYEIKSISLDKPLLNAVINEDGTANWDIMKVKEKEVVEDTAETLHAPSLQLQLRKFVIANGHIYYTDKESGMSAAIENLGFKLSGNMSAFRTGLALDLSAGKISFINDNIKYISDAQVAFRATVDARLDSMIFMLKDNSFKINDIMLNWSGSVSMPDDEINIDLLFNAPETSFKSLLSMVPAFYMKDFAELNASGTFSIDGTVKGAYSSADSTMPDITARLMVKDGAISYPDLPEKITAININGKVVADGKDMDKTSVDISRFHFELAGNPFDMTLKLATPISDPSVTVVARGKIDLARLQQALPMDSLTLDGLIDISLNIAGRMSMIENKHYDQFRADGSLSISDMAFEMTDMPRVKISTAALTFSPAWSELSELKMTIGEKSDFSLSGRLENYIPYLFSDGILKGSLALSSNSVDLNEILNIIPSDTTVKDTTAMEVIRVPEDIDFTFNAMIRKLVFNKLEASDVRGNIIVRDGVVRLNETGMKALGGSLLMNAAYDTRDTLKPVVDADLQISAVSIKEAFNTFNTVQKLMPMASGLGGNVSVRMSYNSLLGQNIMPVISTISGNGEIRSESVQILETKTFDQMKSLLKIDPSYTNTLKDLKATFIINDGRLFIKPFDTKLGNIKLNISGDQGLDKTLNYLIKTEIPRAELGAAAGALMSTLSAEAASFGLNIPVPEIIKVNLKVSGTFKKLMITPVFAGSTGEGAGTSVVQAVKEEVTEKVNEAVRQQADKILKEAEEKAQVLRDQAASSAETIRKEADLQGKRLTKEAESKGAIALLAARKAADALNKEADRRAAQLVSEANTKADKILAEARAKADEILK
jgi:hypothetical protein